MHGTLLGASFLAERAGPESSLTLMVFGIADMHEGIVRRAAGFAWNLAKTLDFRTHCDHSETGWRGVIIRGPCHAWGCVGVTYLKTLDIPKLSPVIT